MFTTALVVYLLVGLLVNVLCERYCDADRDGDNRIMRVLVWPFVLVLLLVTEPSNANRQD